MGWWNRFATLVRADAHGVVDALGDEALLLRQHLRDAEAELDRERAELGRLLDERKTLDRERERRAAEVADLERDVDLALASDRDDLARFTLRKLLAGRRLAAATDARRAEVVTRAEDLAETLARQEDEWSDLESRVRQRLRQLESSPDDRGWRPVEPCVTDEEVELELLRRTGERPGGPGARPGGVDSDASAAEGGRP